MKVFTARNMSILDAVKKPRAKKTETSTAAEKKPKTTKKVAKSDDASASRVLPEALIGLLRRPHVSEKAANLTASNTYVFNVPLHAEKVSIRKAVEITYGVRVISVRTIRTSGKVLTRGRRQGVRSETKKALVTIADGQKIDLYQGV